MIIRSIQAENVLKYEHMDLRNLPAQGLIGVSGQNESGKSSIGETICFALFGRTFSLDHNDLGKLIRWGENRCSVTINFSEENGNSYTLTRSLNIDGNHSAKLCRTKDPDKPIAIGVNPVAEAMFELTAFGYDEFIESFYLAQREITSPHPHSLTLKTIAGISTLEKGAALIEQELHNDETKIEKLQAELGLTKNELEDMEIDPNHLDKLLAKKRESEKEKQKLGETISNYDSSLEEYTRSLPQLINSKTMRHHLSLVLALNAIILVIMLIIWLSNIAPHLSGAIGWVILPALPLGFLIRDHSSKIKRLSKTGQQLASLINQISSTPEMPEEEINSCEQLANQITNGEVDGAKILQKMGPALKHLKGLVGKHETKIQELAEPISLEEKRRDTAASLEKKAVELKDKIKEHTNLNEARRISIELLDGASRHLSKRFNHVIREHVGMTLPLFTEGRYEHLEIDNDMAIRVFSNEKRGYLDLDEISSGTQRQIMLAVRLALSQELASRRVKNRQFLILDEPFAFFDRERTINSLSVLPELSEDLPQIFVTSQVFPRGSKFQRKIACKRETKVLK